MDAKEFFDTVAKMRKVQKDYAKFPTQYALQESKSLEKRIDAEIERVNKIMQAKANPTLF